MKMNKLLPWVFFLYPFLHELHSSKLPIEVETIFRNRSHQNPWFVGEPIRHRSSAIAIDSNTYFTITLANEIPLQGEIISSEKPNQKLFIRKYDPSTGFTLISRETSSKKISYQISFPKSYKNCLFEDPKYVQLPFSSLQIKSFKIDNLRSEFVFQNEKFCGIRQGQYVIPFDYIELFIKSELNSPFAHPGFDFEDELNSSEKSFYFPEGRKGILVTTVYPGIGPLNRLYPGDAIFAINGIPLSSIPKDSFHHTVYDLILRNKGRLLTIGSQIKLSVNRMGKNFEIVYKLKPYNESEFLVPSSHPNIEPPYLISGGIFFTELTGAYLKEFGKDYRLKSEKKLLYITEYFASRQHPHRDRIVILSRVIPHPFTKAYHNFQDLILESVNEQKVRNLPELKQLILSTRENFIRFQFSGSKQIILEKSELFRIDEEISNSYNINSLDNIGY